MSEQVFYYIVIGSILFFGLLNVFLDVKFYKKIIIQIKETNDRVDGLWGHIHRIDSELKEIRFVIDSDARKSKEAIESAYKELKDDILYWEKQRDEMVEKNRFDNNVFINRLNNHSKRIVYLKKVLDKLFDHKVEIKHKEKLLKLAGELEKW